MKLPEYLAFFGGRRFVPIATGISAVCLGLLFGVIWPPLQQGINGLGQLMLESGSFGAFAFGVLNRLLIVTGLHHILNNLVWFVFGSFTDPETGRVVTGDLARYFAGDPKGGQFMAGMFPVMMFGLPAACLAMYRNARPERRKLIGGLLLSMALTAFLTGVTEPVEFAFMFLAPLLYLLHALLTGLSMALTDLLDIRLGFTFSGGAIDLALGWGRSTHGWMLWPLGLLYAGIYYLVFDFCIRRFNLKTPGREDDASSESGDNAEAERAPAFIRAPGGAANLEVVDACTTRLRLRLVDRDKASDAQLKALGAMAVVRPGKAGSLQVVVGPQADSIADEIRRALPFDTQPGEAIPPLGSPHTAEEVVAMQATVDAAEAQAWLGALGGAGNLREVRDVALTRLRVSVADERSWPPSNCVVSADRASVPSPAASAISWWAPRRGEPGPATAAAALTAGGLDLGQSADNRQAVIRPTPQLPRSGSIIARRLFAPRHSPGSGSPREADNERAATGRPSCLSEENSEDHVGQAPDLVGRGLIGMRRLQRLDAGVDELVGHHQLHFPLRHVLDLADLAHVGLATVQGPELALAKGLPAATVVRPDAPATRGKHRLLDDIQMALRHIETQLVHRFLRTNRMLHEAVGGCATADAK